MINQSLIIEAGTSANTREGERGGAYRRYARYKAIAKQAGKQAL
jgi:hypothetical protein